MQSDDISTTSSAGIQVAERATTATEKGKGKERSQDNVVESFPSLTNNSESTTKSTNVADANPASIRPPPEAPTTVASSHTPLPPHLASENPSIQHRSRSRPTSRDTSPYPRSRPSTPNRPSTPSSSSPKAVAPRRSQRTIARGSDRPRGPPELEAALAIAIRNLESDIYEWWCANQKPGSPIPTTAYLKSRSPRIRRAAEAVDEADRLLNEAVYGKPKKPRTVKKAQLLPKPSSNPPGEESPEMALEHLELNPHGSFPLPPAAPEASPKPDSTDGLPPRLSAISKEDTSGS